MFWNPGDNVSGFYGIPREMTGIGSKLKGAGYSTHFLGKWDAGMATPEHTPLGRGFDTFLGTLESVSDYWSEDHSHEKWVVDACGNEFKDFSLYNATYRGGVSARIAAELGCDVEMSVPLTSQGCSHGEPKVCLPESCYKEAMLLQYALKLINAHEPSTPLFLTYATQLIHPPLETTKSSIRNLEDAVAQTSVERKLHWTRARKLMSASLLESDRAMGLLVQALKERDMYQNTLVVFLSDNGGGVHLRASANNHPLKGGKFSDWEGGVRTNAFISGGFVPPEKRGTSFHGVIHIADWYPTLCGLAGVKHFDDKAAKVNEMLEVQGLPLLNPVDGRPQMQHIFSGSNGRPDTLHLSETSLLRWPYKLVTGKQAFSLWQGPVFPNCSSVGPLWLYADVLGHKVKISSRDGIEEDCGKGCLFNVEVDPSEHSDLAPLAEYETLLTRLQEELVLLNANASKADLGKARSACCLQAARNGGFLGPFIDVEGFYTPVSMSGLESLETERYHKDLSLNNETTSNFRSMVRVKVSSSP